MSRFIKVCVLFCLAIYWFPANPSTAGDGPNAKPNFVVILCDDLGWGDLGCYGHPHIKTPHLDRLAQEGIRFTHAYSAAVVCSPSRVGLLTGRNPNRAGIYDWIPEANQKADPKNHRHMVHLRKSELTLPMLLKSSGYATAVTGKWHCNAAFNQPTQPQPNDAGFDHWFATQNNASPSHDHPNNFVRNGEPVGEQKGFSSHMVANEAIQWMESQKANDPKKPFFLYVAFHEPHEPVASPRELVDKYRSVARNEDEAQYFANVENMDEAVGKIIAALESLHLDQNTVVYFSSDNGPETLNRYPASNRSYGRAGNLKGMKLSTHEGGCRVPGILRWKGKWKSGQESDTPIISLDLLPTFCQLADVANPTNRKLDGASLVPLLNGEKHLRSKPLVWLYYHSTNEQSMAMRDGDYKIMAKLSVNGKKLPKFSNVTKKNEAQIQSAVLSDFSLFDLKTDPGETENLVGSEIALFDRMRDRLEVAYRDILHDSYIWDE